MTEQLYDIFADIFDLEPDEIHDDLTPEDVQLWDSLNHLKLVTAVEQAFGVQFTMSELQSINSVAKLRVLIRHHR